MALTPSTMLPLGTTAPDFQLPDTNGKTVSLADFKRRARAARHFHVQPLSVCHPHPRRTRATGARLRAEKYRHRRHQFQRREKLSRRQPGQNERSKWKPPATFFHISTTRTQAVAKAYRAACTPDIFLFDRGRRLVYRGQFDASRPGNGIPVTGKDLRAALDAVLAGKPTSEFQAPASAATSSGKPATNRIIFDLRFTICAPTEICRCP